LEEAEQYGSNWTTFHDVLEPYHIDTAYLNPANLTQLNWNKSWTPTGES
jgi:hypothetical protein